MGEHGREGRAPDLAEYRLETPTATDDGYVAVQVADGARRLVRISADGKTVAPIADGDYHRPPTRRTAVCSR